MNWVVVLLEIALTATVTGPVLAPLGTLALICVSPQLSTVAGTPLKLIVLSRCVDWKPKPFMVTSVPEAPPAGIALSTCGGGTVKLTVVLLSMLLTVTTTGPVVAVFGTTATILVSLQLVIEAAAWPLKLTVLVP